MRPHSCGTASPPAGSTEGAELLYPPRDLWLTQLHPSSAQAVCPGSRAPCWEPKTLPGVSGTEGQECFALLQSRRRGCSQLLAPWYRGSLTSPAPPLTRPVAPATPPVPPGFVFARICAVARAARCAGVWWRRGRTGRKEAPLMPCSCSARATHLSDPGSGFTHVVLVFVGTGHRGKEAGVWLAGSFQQSPAAAAGSLACITDPLCLRAV